MTGKLIAIIAAITGLFALLGVLGVVLLMTSGDDRADDLEAAMTESSWTEYLTPEQIRCFAEGLANSDLSEPEQDQWVGDAESDRVYDDPSTPADPEAVFRDIAFSCGPGPSGSTG